LNGASLQEPFLRSIFEEVWKMADVTMPMNGKVIEVKAQVGQSVDEDAELVIIEAMKMELPVVAPQSGTVKEVKAQVGESYQVGDVLVVIE
jgi:biotin carboxyl carrier protein